MSKPAHTARNGLDEHPCHFGVQLSIGLRWCEERKYGQLGQQGTGEVDPALDV